MDTKVISMGLDAGMGAIKMWSEQGGLEVLSQVAVNGSGHLERMLGLKSDERPLLVSTSDGDFYVGAKAHNYGRPIENLDFDRLIGSPEMRALVYGTWSRYIQRHGAFEIPIMRNGKVIGKEKASLSLMVGLPLQTMGEDMKDYRKQMRAWLSGPHKWDADDVEYTVMVERVRTNSQPVGALFDFILDDALEMIPEHRGVVTKEIGIISVGFNTVELMVVKDQIATEKFTGGDKLGVRRLLDLLNPKRLYSYGELDMMLRSGELKVKDKLTIWAREVNGVVEQKWIDAKGNSVLDRFAAVLVVGGGAVLLGDQLKLHGKGVVASEPVMSISHGLWKLDRAKR